MDASRRWRGGGVLGESHQQALRNSSNSAFIVSRSNFKIKCLRGAAEWLSWLNRAVNHVAVELGRGDVRRWTSFDIWDQTLPFGL